MYADGGLLADRIAKTYEETGRGLPCGEVRELLLRFARALSALSKAGDVRCRSNQARSSWIARERISLLLRACPGRVEICEIISRSRVNDRGGPRLHRPRAGVGTTDSCRPNLPISARLTRVACNKRHVALSMMRSTMERRQAADFRAVAAIAQRVCASMFPLAGSNRQPADRGQAELAVRVVGRIGVHAVEAAVRGARIGAAELRRLSEECAETFFGLVYTRLQERLSPEEWMKFSNVNWNFSTRPSRSHRSLAGVPCAGRSGDGADQSVACRQGARASRVWIHARLVCAIRRITGGFRR